MSEHLEAWFEGAYAGRFTFEGGGVSFVYDANAPQIPISLSLPRDQRPASRSAAQRFLENLLPEQQQTRARMASVYGAANTSLFALLSKAGGDLAGGLMLLPEGREPEIAAADLAPALPRDIAQRIAAIKRDSSDAVPSGVPARFSLAGAQGKFALARVESDWYWPNESVPSTHIVKPGSPRFRGIEAAECAALRLAQRAGIDAPTAEVQTHEQQTAFVVTRFDRLIGQAPLARRLHVEDLAQSLGVAPERKYGVPASKILALLARLDPQGALRRAFLDQLIFNVLLGNADAHAKNYSLLLRPGGCAIAPIYDVVPLFLYPEVDQKLAMKIAGASFSQAVNLPHWRKFAMVNGLDADELQARVRSIAQRVGEQNAHAWNELDHDQAQHARAFVSRNVDRILGSS
ncbi:HipA domain-containing protein [Leucobacter sp. HY1908]